MLWPSSAWQHNTVRPVRGTGIWCFHPHVCNTSNSYHWVRANLLWLTRDTKSINRLFWAKCKMRENGMGEVRSTGEICNQNKEKRRTNKRNKTEISGGYWQFRAHQSKTIDISQKISDWTLWLNSAPSSFHVKNYNAKPTARRTNPYSSGAYSLQLRIEISGSVANR